MPIIAALFVVVLGAALFTLRKSVVVSATAERCREAQRRLDAQGQGGDLNVRAELVREIYNCAQDLAAAGVAYDASALSLDIARSAASRMREEWNHYVGTDWSDFGKRTSTRRGMYRTAKTEMIPALMQSAREATTVTQLAAVRGVIVEEINASLARASCFVLGGFGCGRLGVNEDGWGTRANDELENVLLPLGYLDAVADGWQPQPAGTWEDFVRYVFETKNQFFHWDPDTRFAPLARARDLWRDLHPQTDEHGRVAALVTSWTGAETPYAIFRAKRDALATPAPTPAMVAGSPIFTDIRIDLGRR